MARIKNAKKNIKKKYGSSDIRRSRDSYKGCPEEVGEDFSCVGCKRLTSLEGAPEEVGGSFFCSDNKLTSLEGAPKKVKENFYCSGNTKKFTKADVEKVCKVMDSIYCYG